MNSLNIKKVLVVYKQSLYQRHVLGNAKGAISKLMKSKSPATRKLSSTHRQHMRTLALVNSILQKDGVFFKTETGKKTFSISSYDLVITLGGDGTLLRTAHRIKNKMIVGVNSAPSTSRGALCSVVGSEFESFWKKIRRGQAKLEKRYRLQVEVNGKVIEAQALNDVLFSNACPAGTSRYLIKFQSKSEDQKSSGVWIATASGSSAAILAAGGVRLAPTSDQMQYLVREPFSTEVKKYRLVRGFFKANQKMIFINKTINAAIYIDGMQKIVPLKFGDEITVSQSKHPLWVLK